MSDFIPLGNDTTVARRHLAILTVVKGEIGYNLTAIMSDGLPSASIDFAKKENAMEAYNKAVEVLNEKCES